MSSLPWFRLYRELKDDPKIGALDDASFRLFIESLCWACEKGDGGKTGLTMENANWAFRRNVSETFQPLFQKRLLALLPDGEIVVPKWDERQCRSDVSTERVRRFREKNNETERNGFTKRDETVQEERRGDKKRGERALDFKKPTFPEMELHAAKIGLPTTEVQKFYSYHDSKGWVVGKSKMVSWKAAMVTWREKQREFQAEKKSKQSTNGNF